MDAFMPLFVLSLCASVRSEPLPEAVQRRSDAGVYASGYSRGYEPVAFAAIPLHAPIPVQYVRMLPARAVPPPPRRDQLRYAPSANRPTYALPPQQHFEGYPQPNRYAPFAGSMNYVVYADEDPEETAAPSILYARPNPSGGYTYRRKPTKKRSPPKRPTDEPILIRVHKYRIIRDR